MNQAQKDARLRTLEWALRLIMEETQKQQLPITSKVYLIADNALNRGMVDIQDML